MSQETIDTCTVDLTLDNQNFVQGHQAARNEQAKTKQSAVGFLQSIRTEAAATFAILASGYGFKELVENVTNTTAALGLLAHNLELNAREIQSWGNVTEMFGGSAGALQGTVQNLSNEFTKLRITGESALLPFLNKVADIPRNDPLEFLEQLKARMDALNDPQQSALFYRGLGIDQGTINSMLNTTGEKFHSLMEEQKAKNKIDDESIKKAQALKESYVNFKTTLYSVYQQFVDEISPGIESGFKKIETAAAYLSDHKEIVIGFFTALGAAALAATAPMWLAVLPIAGLGIAIGALYDDFQTFKKGGEHLIDWQLLIDKTTEAINKIKIFGYALQDLKKDFIEAGKSSDNVLFKDFALGIENLSGLISKTFRSLKNELSSIFPDLIRDLNEAIDIFNMVTGTKIKHVGWGDKDQLKREAMTVEVHEEMVRDEEESRQSKPIDTAKDFGSSPLGKAMVGHEGDYNVVNLGKANGGGSGKVDLESKTVNQVLSDQQNKEYNAAGRYQITPSTLKQGVKETGLTGNELFNKETQDKLGAWALGQKRPALDDYVQGKSEDINGALLALSQEMASFPRPDTGESYYPDNNKASLTVDEAKQLLTDQRNWTLARANTDTVTNTEKTKETAVPVIVTNTEKTQVNPEKQGFLDNWKRAKEANQDVKAQHEKIAAANKEPQESLADKWTKLKDSIGNIVIKIKDSDTANESEPIEPQAYSNDEKSAQQHYAKPEIMPLQSIQYGQQTTNNNNTNTNAPVTSTETNIGTININTQATDAAGIGKHINRVITHQADFGTR